MSLKSFLPAAAALAMASVALTGCMNNTTTSRGSSDPATSSSSEASDRSNGDRKSDNATPFTINESNGSVTVPAGTTKVIVNGSNLSIQGDNLTEITVNGSNNRIDVDSLKQVSFTGSNNTVAYDGGSTPQIVSDSGANNSVTKG